MSMLTPRGVGGHAPVRRGRRRRRLLKTLLVLLVIGALAAGGWYYLLRDATTTAKTATAAPTASCPAPSPAPTPVSARLVKLNVFNATERRGLAATVATELRRRGFRVAKVGNDPAGRTVAGVAEVRSSPAGTAAARTVASQVDAFVAVPDRRPDGSVDLVLGRSFKALRTPARAATASRPSPSAVPSGC
jgi:hypothetical protein